MTYATLADYDPNKYEFGPKYDLKPEGSAHGVPSTTTSTYPVPTSIAPDYPTLPKPVSIDSNTVTSSPTHDHDILTTLDPANPGLEF